LTETTGQALDSYKFEGVREVNQIDAARSRQKKARVATGFFSNIDLQCQLGMDSAYRAGIYACSAVDTGIGIDNTLRTLLSDSVNRTRILTCCTVCAIISNSMGHNFTSLLD